MTGQMVKLPEDEDTPEKRVDKIFRLMDLDKNSECMSPFIFTQCHLTSSRKDQNRIPPSYKHFHYTMGLCDENCRLVFLIMLENRGDLVSYPVAIGKCYFVAALGRIHFHQCICMQMLNPSA